MTAIRNEISLDVRMTRRGVALEPRPDAYDAAGVLNPASLRTRDGRLLLLPRVVAEGNVSRVGLYERDGSGAFARAGMALEPEAAYELRDQGDGRGCEDPRVTFIPALDRYVMGYTAFGPDGPRIAVALSEDGLAWTRLGLMDFRATDFVGCYDKDAAFFPEPVVSPTGVESIACYHRPAYTGRGRLVEDIRLAYIPLEGVRRDLRNLLKVQHSERILRAGGRWGLVKVGGGTPPIRTPEGWLSLYHGVDRQAGADFSDVKYVYRAGVMVHDLAEPHRLRYASKQPVFVPEREAERRGVVDNVVFPTAIDVEGHAPGSAMVYYGMADFAIGAALLEYRFGPAAKA